MVESTTKAMLIGTNPFISQILPQVSIDQHSNSNWWDLKRTRTWLEENQKT